MAKIFDRDDNVVLQYPTYNGSIDKEKCLRIILYNGDGYQGAIEYDERETKYIINAVLNHLLHSL